MQYVFGYAKVKLCDIATLKRGVRVVKQQLSKDDKYPVYQNCLAPMGYYDKSNCHANSTYIISAGAAGDVGYSQCDFWAADDCLVFSDLHGIIDKFAYYCLLSQQEFLYSNVRRASIPRLSKESIERITIYLPPLERQQEIVEILDNFDKLVNDLSNGLPAEIEARQKQYEYYREKLLTFKEID